MYEMGEEVRRVYPTNSDGYTAGNSVNTTMDEKKVLDNTVCSVDVEFAPANGSDSESDL